MEVHISLFFKDKIFSEKCKEFLTKYALKSGMLRLMANTHAISLYNLSVSSLDIDMDIDISISLGNVLRYIFGIIGSAVGGALRGLKFKLNPIRKYFADKKQYKADLALYNAEKLEKENTEAENAEETNCADEEKTESDDGENNNEDLMTETSERENTNVSEE